MRCCVYLLIASLCPLRPSEHIRLRNLDLQNQGCWENAALQRTSGYVDHFWHDVCFGFLIRVPFVEEIPLPGAGQPDLQQDWMVEVYQIIFLYTFSVERLRSYTHSDSLEPKDSLCSALSPLHLTLIKSPDIDIGDELRKFCRCATQFERFGGIIRHSEIVFAHQFSGYSFQILHGVHSFFLYCLSSSDESGGRFAGSKKHRSLLCSYEQVCQNHLGYRSFISISYAGLRP